MLASDGLLYVPGTNAIYAIDPETGNVVKVESPGKMPFLCGVDNDVVYFGAGNNLQAARFDDLVREFYADSTLIQDFDVAASHARLPHRDHAV